MKIGITAATLPRLRRMLAAVGIVLGAGACAHAPPLPVPEPRVEARAVPAEAKAAPSVPLPPLPVSQSNGAGTAARRIQQLEVLDEDLGRVIRSLAESYGLDYQIDPGVSGRVTARLREVTLEQALDAVVLPSGYGYQIQGSVLRVAPTAMETRIFTLDYIAMSRAGVGTTVIQRRLGAAGQGGQNQFQQQTQGYGGAGGSADIIQSVAVSDLWQEIRVSLQGLIFADGEGGAAITESGAAGAAGGQPLGQQGASFGFGAQAPGPSSVGAADGRRLIVNPLSGTILIAAPPARLAQVVQLLSTIEASVQRQVLIEAKIVEVTLRRGFEFGIDWSFLKRLGDLNVSLGGDASGVQFTLGSRSEDQDAGQRVNVVLRSLETQGDVRVLSSPRVSVLNNQRAVINVTTDEVFFAVTRQPIIGPTGATIGFTTEVEPQQIAVGIVMDVFPQISADNVITMSVRPVITNLIEVRSLVLEDETQITAPVIDRRETDTVVRVRGGETVVIGGLIQNSRRDDREGVPLIQRIPGLRWLFSRQDTSEERRELVIFLTPSIVAGPAQHAAR